ncbi:hypothetical protein AYO21_01359 [Fonsecaea monophora]|uniref:Uncharacterized protein n=1 Tax=Fonsecaea monophora TaxID=254056 RepID=A0A177FJ64_9EURO|nr:hypothetical protein AYO21_01359 [Fonsecaea monophora]KAH0845969.1 hypothetical protein FOPE_12333 [Fonsecaea pedrosoi]OAG44363.1 hypothetical protein AYO21_01359 [Fonsecaea monophora]
MVALTSILWLAAIFLLGFVKDSSSARRFDRRSDLDYVPPINASAAAGWSVPLQGSKTCDPNKACTDSLSPPTPGKPLQYLAIARGLYMYLCAGNGPSEPAKFQSQSTQLYDAAPLIQNLPNEAAFHALPAKLHDFDYEQLRNSTLECMGTIGTVNDTAIITLFDIATFEALPYESVLAPDNPGSNSRWAHSVSPKGDWDIYRVEVAGGTPPVCDSQRLMAEEEYTAEYWFFYSGGEDIWTPNDIMKEALIDSIDLPAFI